MKHWKEERNLDSFVDGDGDDVVDVTAADAEQRRDASEVLVKRLDETSSLRVPDVQRLAHGRHHELVLRRQHHVSASTVLAGSRHQQYSHITPFTVSSQ